MTDRDWEIASSTALDGELDAVETLALLDAMAGDRACREHWVRLRAFDRELDPLIEPAGEVLPRQRPRGNRAWWLAPVAAAALLAAVVLGPSPTGVSHIGPPNGLPVTVRLEESRGEMSEQRFVELVVELLRADLRYQNKMLEVLEEVRPEASLAEAGSGEDDRNQTEHLALARGERPAISIDELPWEALAGIH